MGPPTKKKSNINDLEEIDKRHFIPTKKKNKKSLTMPRSKRARVVHETRTAKKSHKEQTRRLFTNVRECVENYEHLFIFSVDNMRNTYLKDVRSEFAEDGR